jgi:hypothetical protein
MKSTGEPPMREETRNNKDSLNEIVRSVQVAVEPKVSDKKNEKEGQKSDQNSGVFRSKKQVTFLRIFASRKL